MQEGDSGANQFANNWWELGFWGSVLFSHSEAAGDTPLIWKAHCSPQNMA